jgi:hypothetical protein
MPASSNLPSFATHYYLGSRRPFLNLSDLSEAELARVLGELNQQGAASSSKRIFGRRYMELRRLTEAKLRRLFIEAGGQPERYAPHYLILGQSEWFKGLSPDTQELRIPLSQLPTHVTSATYPDSFTAMAYGPQFNLPYEPKPYHEKAFRLEELSALVQEYGLPRDEDGHGYDGYSQRPFEKYIEIQVWSDAPVQHFLRELKG